MKKIIHIHAKCEAFEIWEQVPENKSVSRLITIKNMFNSIGSFGDTVSTKVFRLGGDKLVVNTRVVNPEFDFK